MKVEDAYARGSVSFMGLDLAVGPGALVPREETELLARTAIDLLQQIPAANGGELRVIDMCCGAGNLACAIAHHVPRARVWATDLTDGCVALAARNAAALGLSGRVIVHQGDLFQPLAALDLEGTIDAVVCNPPYISEKRLSGESAHLLEREPREAFAAGPYGLDIHMRVVREALPYLRPGGALLFEVGLGQDRQVKLLFQRAKAYAEATIVANEAGEGRVVLAPRR